MVQRRREGRSREERRKKPVRKTPSKRKERMNAPPLLLIQLLTHHFTHLPKLALTLGIIALDHDGLEMP